MNKICKKALVCLLVAVMVVSAAACTKGGKAQTGDVGDAADGLGGQGGDMSPKWQYEFKELNVDAAQEEFYAMKQVGDNLYYPVRGDGGAQSGDSHICRYDVLKGSAEELPVAFGGYLQMFDIGVDGSIYAVTMDYSASKDGQKLEKYDASGKRVYSVAVDEWVDTNKPDNKGYLIGMSSDGEGRVYLACKKMVFLFDAQGEFAGGVDPTGGKGEGENSGITTIGRGKEGAVYVIVMDDNMKRSLAGIDFTKKSSDTVIDNFAQNGGSNLGAGPEKDFLANNGSVVYEYDLASKTMEALFSWTDCGLNGATVISLGAVSDGRLLAVSCDWSAGGGSVMLLSKVTDGGKKQKEEIVLGAVKTVTEMDNAVAAFNKSSDKYHIKVKNYLANAEWTIEAADDARNRMVMDIIAGNGPDIIDLSGFPGDQTQALAEQGFLEDLSLWLDKSELLGKDDFVENVLEMCVYDGILASIPKQFTLHTMIGYASELGEPGWSLEDLMAVGDKHSGALFSQYAGKGNVLMLGLRYNLDSFVDYETGKCSFDSPEFIRWMEFADRHGGQSDLGWDILYEKIWDRELLLMEMDLYDFYTLQYYNEVFEGDMSMVGYPTSDGSAASSLLINQECGMLTNSQHKEGVWAFLESLAMSKNSKYMYALPVLKVRMDEFVQEARQEEGRVMYQKDSDGNYIVDEIGNFIPEYEKDADGELVLDENGNPVPIIITRTMRYGGESAPYVDCHRVTDAEEEQLMSLIRQARPPRAEDYKIRAIISEEAAVFFEGVKPAQDVADVIQRRVQLYLNENR